MAVRISYKKSAETLSLKLIKLKLELVVVQFEKRNKNIEEKSELQCGEKAIQQLGQYK